MESLATSISTAATSACDRGLASAPRASVNGGGACIEPQPRAVRPAQRAELDRDLNPVAQALEAAAHQKLVVAHAVEVAGVEQRDAALDGGADGCDALVVVGLSIDAGHAHAAEADGKPPAPSCRDA